MAQPTDVDRFRIASKYGTVWLCVLGDGSIAEIIGIESAHGGFVSGPEPTILLMRGANVSACAHEASHAASWFGIADDEERATYIGRLAAALAECAR